jgi:hypothetical protein
MSNLITPDTPNSDMGVLFDKRKLHKVFKNGGILLRGKPKKLKCPGDTVQLVELVGKDPYTICEFIVSSLNPEPFKQSNGWVTGCFVKFLSVYKVLVIWEKTNGEFTDNDGGRWTKPSN